MRRSARAPRRACATGTPLRCAVDSGSVRIALIRHALLHEGALLLQVELERLLFASFCSIRGRLAFARVRLVPNGIVVGIDIDLRRLGFGPSGRGVPTAAAPDDVIARVAAMHLLEQIG